MRVALVHDYIGELGGAERVLLALSEIWPDAPIYTAFYREGPAWNRFKDKDVRVSWAHHIPGFSTWFHSPLRFLAPLIWDSVACQLKDYDLVVSSASWYVTKGFGQGPTSLKSSTLRAQTEGLRGTTGKPVEICYCHTPPRYLYGYQTSIEKSWLTAIYSTLVNPFMRWYDKRQAQKVNYFIANSKNVQDRIKKFYGRESVVIYPPVGLEQRTKDKGQRGGNYYLVVARIVGGKGIEMAVEAAQRLGVPLKIVGSSSGHAEVYERLKQKAGNNIEFLGFVDDEKLAELYRGAKALLALAQDEDFGITPVEAMQEGTPVIAYNGGGYRETVKDGETGVLFDDYSVDGLIGAIKKFEKMKFNPDACKKQGEKFSKERFKEEIKEFISYAWIARSGILS